jgi:CheY-like chemotaxis protein
VKPRLLIVDDDPEVLDWLERALAPAYEVTRAESGAAALAALAGGGFAALVTDESMPGMRGSELCARAAALDPALARVLVTGFSEALDRSAADRVVVKPIESSALRHMIADTLVAKATNRR